MASATALEINASAGEVGTSYRVKLNRNRDSRLRINADPTRTATVTNIDGGTIRQATVDNAGSYGVFADVAVGSSFTVVAADGARECVLMTGDTAALSVVIS